MIFFRLTTEKSYDCDELHKLKKIQCDIDKLCKNNNVCEYVYKHRYKKINSIPNISKHNDKNDKNDCNDLLFDFLKKQYLTRKHDNPQR